MTEKRAIVLAGGEGRRLAPYTFVIPKPIVPIGTTPILEIVLGQLAHSSFARVTVALGHMSEIVRAVAGDGSKFGITVDYADEVEPLGTIGPLRRIEDLPDDFLVMNADLLTDIDFGHLWGFHLAHGGVATVATFRKATQLGVGVLDTDASGRVISFEEKPTLYHSVSMGIYVFRRDVLRYVPPDQYFGFDMLMGVLLKAGEPVHVYPFAGRWLDIGVPADYEAAQVEFEQNRGLYLHGQQRDRR